MKEKNANSISISGMLVGYSVKNNYDVELKLRFTESEVTTALLFVGGIGNTIKMQAEVRSKKVNLGGWTVYRVAIDKEAQTTVVFKSNLESTNTEEFSVLATEEEEIKLKAVIKN